MKIKQTTIGNGVSKIEILYTEALQSELAFESAYKGLFTGDCSPGNQMTLRIYVFACYCMNNPEKADQLEGWKDYAVNEIYNQYLQPLKFLSRNNKGAIQNRQTYWAAIFKYANETGITEDNFLDHLQKNGGARRWNDNLKNLAQAKAKRNEKGLVVTKPSNDNESNNGVGNGKDSNNWPALNDVDTSPPDDCSEPANDNKVEDINAKVEQCPKSNFVSEVKKAKKIYFVAYNKSTDEPIGRVKISTSDCVNFLHMNDERYVKGAA